jgi:hypothetical protein
MLSRFYIATAALKLGKFIQDVAKTITIRIGRYRISESSLTRWMVQFCLFSCEAMAVLAFLLQNLIISNGNSQKQTMIVSVP